MDKIAGNMEPNMLCGDGGCFLFSQMVGTVTACITSEYTYILRFYVCYMCVCVCIVRMEKSTEKRDQKYKRERWYLDKRTNGTDSTSVGIRLGRRRNSSSVGIHQFAHQGCQYKYHRLDTWLKQRKFFPLILKARSPRSRSQQSQFLLRSLCVACKRQSFYFCLHTVFPLYVSVS